MVRVQKCHYYIIYFIKICFRLFWKQCFLVFRTIKPDKPLLKKEDQKEYDALNRIIEEKLLIHAEEKLKIADISGKVLRCMQYKDNVSITFY